MAKEYDGLKLYDLTGAQDVYVMMMKFSIYKNIANIPFCLLLDQKIDWDLMQKAYEIEVQRNDSLRMRFVKTKDGVKQYFLPEVDLPPVEYKDFSDATQEEMESWLNHRASRTFKFYKGDLFEVIFFNTPDGRSGIYFCVFHMAMDTYAMILFFNDLVNVYAALKNGSEMPAPLSKFEDTIKKDIQYLGSEREKKDDAYFQEYWEKLEPCVYSGIDGGRELERVRKKKKDPNYLFVNNLHLFKNKTRLLLLHVDKATTDRWVDFVIQNKITYQALLHLGMHIAATGLNGRAEASSCIFTENRRTKISEMRCGGCRVHGHIFISVIPKGTKVMDALAQVGIEQLKRMRHADFGTTRIFDYVIKSQKIKITQSNFFCNYSLLPPGSVQTPEGFDCDLIVLDAGRFMTSCMHTIFPNLKKGGMDFAYKNYVSQFTEEDIRNYHDLCCKAVEAIIANPDGTIEDIYNTIF